VSAQNCTEYANREDTGFSGILRSQEGTSKYETTTQPESSDTELTSGVLNALMKAFKCTNLIETPTA
jgi:hypothetical protein